MCPLCIWMACTTRFLGIPIAQQPWRVGASHESVNPCPVRSGFRLQEEGRKVEARTQELPSCLA